MADNIINIFSKVPELMNDALQALDRLDAEIKAARARWGNPPDRFSQPGFSALVRIILGQQISRAVANTLWSRMTEHNWCDAPSLAALDYTALQNIGLSRRKAEYIIDLARAEAEGRLDLEALGQQPAEIFTQKLIAYRGLVAGRSAITDYSVWLIWMPGQAMI